jgi:hypothetical protein
MEIPSDDWYDELALQVLVCDACALSEIGTYSESRRGALDSEAVDHEGFHADAEVIVRVRRLIRSCPRPGDASCDCEGHRVLGQSVGGRWDVLSLLKSPYLRSFRVKYSEI